MTTLEVKLDLPESLAKEARQAGLLAPEELERLVREALRASANAVEPAFAKVWENDTDAAYDRL